MKHNEKDEKRRKWERVKIKWDNGRLDYAVKWWWQCHSTRSDVVSWNKVARKIKFAILATANKTICLLNIFLNKTDWVN